MTSAIITESAAYRLTRVHQAEQDLRNATKQVEFFTECVAEPTSPSQTRLDERELTGWQRRLAAAIVERDELVARFGTVEALRLAASLEG